VADFNRDGSADIALTQTVGQALAKRWCGSAMRGKRGKRSPYTDNVRLAKRLSGQV